MLVIYVGIVSLLCFAAFAWDKFCARHGLWRIPERTLLLLALIGGTPGAFAGQSLLRHKTQKQPFGFYLLAIAALQSLLLAGLIVLSGGALLLL
jgi:uncharacterized membrane protein YsdA (DUF1294 family)